MQLAGQCRDGVVDQRRATPIVERGGNYLTRSGNRNVDSDCADLGDRLRFFLRDPLLRQLLSPA